MCYHDISKEEDRMRRVECDFHITARTIGRKHRSQLIGEWKGANKCIKSGSRNLPGIISLNVWGKFGQMWVIWSQRQGPDGQNGRLDWCKSDPGSRICQDTHCWRRLFCGHPESMVGSLKFVRCRMFYHIWKSKNICIIQFPDMVIHSAFCKILWFYHRFCTPQNSRLPAVYIWRSGPSWCSDKTP